jgi:hypothetical protein
VLLVALPHHVLDVALCARSDCLQVFAKLSGRPELRDLCWELGLPVGAR